MHMYIFIFGIEMTHSAAIKFDKNKLLLYFPVSKQTSVRFTDAEL